MNTLAEVLDEIASDDEFVEACPMLFEPGRPDIVLVTGENAGGKTFLGSYIAAILRRDADSALEVMDIGMRRRTSSGFGSAFIFGDESWESTGQISSRTVTTAIRTSRDRTKPHLLILDEPDIGLSEGYQDAVGQALAGFASDLPELCVGLVVVTHSRVLARPLQALGPSSVRIGDDLRPLGEWMETGPLPRTIEDLEALQGTANRRFRALSALIARRSEERGAKPGR